MTCDNNAILVGFHKLDETSYIGIRLNKTKVVVIRSRRFVTAAPAFNVGMLNNKNILAVVIVFFQKSLKPVKLSLGKLCALIGVKTALKCHKNKVVACFRLGYLKVRLACIYGGLFAVQTCCLDKGGIVIIIIAVFVPFCAYVVVSKALVNRSRIGRIRKYLLICLVLRSIACVTVLVIYGIA